MILSAIQERRSTREYEAKAVPQNLVREIIRAAQYAPTGMNNRAVEYVVIEDAELKTRLSDVLQPRQPFVKDAPVLIVPVTDTRKTPVANSDLAIASAFIMLQVEALGLGTVWKHVAPEIVPAAAKLLGLPIEYTLINVLPLGYPLKKASAHQETEFSERKIHLGKWQVTLGEDL